MTWEPQGLGLKIFQERYSHDGESWSDACHRVARHVARAEESHDKWAEAFADQLTNNKFMPGGRIWYGAGRTKAQLLNCFVLPTVDSREGWGKTISDVIVVSGTGGGIGVNCSPIRPRGTEIKGTGGKATGAVSLMQLINKVGDVIVGGGNRRTALMLCLNYDHPDIEEFLDAKLNLNQLNLANISVNISTRVGEFQKSVRKGSNIPLNFDGWLSGGSINATYLWEKLVENAWRTGEPGVLNGWTANRDNNIWYYKPLSSTNPCFPASELILLENGYQSFGDLFVAGEPNKVLADNRVSYHDDGGAEETYKWHINPSMIGASLYNASPVQVTRRNADIVKISTDAGYDFRCTPDHRIGTQKGMVEASALVPGQEILLTLPEPISSVAQNHPNTCEEIDAFLMGLIAGDGTFGLGDTSPIVHIDIWGEDRKRLAPLLGDWIDKLYSCDYKSGKSSYSDSCWNSRDMASYRVSEVESKNKTRISSTWLANRLERNYGFCKDSKLDVPKLIVARARDRVGQFYLAGMFYADGSVQDYGGGRRTVRLAQSNENLLKQIQLLLQANGIASRLYTRRAAGMRLLPDGKGGKKEYFCKQQFELIIQRSLDRFHHNIGFGGNVQKESKLRGLVESSNRMKWQPTVKVRNVISCGREDVYCLQQKETRSIVVGGIATVRCGEIWLEDYGCCDLGALVLPRFVKNGQLDWDALAESIRLGVRFLDDVLTVNHYPLEEIKRNCLNVRRIGLGVMGLHSMLLELGYMYSSDSARRFIDELFMYIKGRAYEMSIELAKEKGSFPMYDDRYLDSGFASRLSPTVKRDIKVNGIRNCALLTVAPTGTTSMVAGVSSGIEPLFAPIYYRNYRQIDNNAKEHKARELVVTPEFERFGEIAEGAYDLSPAEHFEIQKIVQKSVDNAVSKTINLPQNYEQQNLSEVWLEYLPHIKGSTIYRSGSRGNEPLEPVKYDDIMKTLLRERKTQESDWSELNSLECPGGVCDISHGASLNAN